MKEVKMYQCEICNEYFELKQSAIDCENDGKEYPIIEIGDEVLKIIKMGGGWSDQHAPLKLSSIEDKGHYLVYRFLEWDSNEDEWYENPGDYAYGNKDLLENYII